MAEVRENMGRKGYGRRETVEELKTRKDGKRDLNEGEKRERNSKKEAFIIFYSL